MRRWERKWGRSQRGAILVDPEFPTQMQLDLWSYWRQVSPPGFSFYSSCVINVILFSSCSRALPTRWKHDCQQLPNFIFYGLCPQRKTASVFWVPKSKKPRETLRSLSWVSFHSWTPCCRSMAARVPEAGRDGNNLLEEQLDKEVVSLLFFYPEFWLRC